LKEHLLFKNDFINLANMLPYYDVDSFQIERCSKDSGRNIFGNDLIQMCINCNFHMLNGRKHGDEHGEFTCITVQGKSFVDYILCSAIIYDRICLCNVVVEDFTPYCMHTDSKNKDITA
jgi:hypothetical protein